MERVRTDCTIAGRIEDKMLDLELRAILSEPRLVPDPAAR